ncbi:MAG: rhodanese-like domain-containing protein [Bacteroidales bacterium]|nr:rhodanese-like domain-containing protein [Bacteroidales bacterium]
MITSLIPGFQEFYLEGVEHVTPHNALMELENGTAVMVDVREEAECKSEFIPLNNVYYFPLSVLTENLGFLPDDKSIIVICNAGVRSSKVTAFLKSNGFPETFNLDGGIIAWKALGLPVKSDYPTGFSCGCSHPG